MGFRRSGWREAAAAARRPGRAPAVRGPRSSVASGTVYARAPGAPRDAPSRPRGPGMASGAHGAPRPPRGAPPAPLPGPRGTRYRAAARAGPGANGGTRLATGSERRGRSDPSPSTGARVLNGKTPALRVACLADQYPRREETFVWREVAGAGVGRVPRERPGPLPAGVPAPRPGHAAAAAADRPHRRRGPGAEGADLAAAARRGGPRPAALPERARRGRQRVARALGRFARPIPLGERADFRFQTRALAELGRVPGGAVRSPPARVTPPAARVGGPSGGGP